MPSLNEIMQSVRITCVVFDTSALLLMFTEGIRIIDQVVELVNSPIIPVIPYPILNELMKLSRLGRPGIARVSRSTLNYAINNFSIADVISSPDDSVIEVARRYNCIAVTCDMKLLRRLRQIGIKAIYLRASSGRLETDD